MIAHRTGSFVLGQECSLKYKESFVIIQLFFLRRITILQLVHVWLLLALSCPAWGQPAAPSTIVQTLSLDEAIALALQHNRLIKNASLEVSKAEHQLSAARTRHFPVFNTLVLQSWDISSTDKNIFPAFPSFIPIPSTDTLVKEQQPTAYFIGQMTQPLTQQYKITLGVHLRGVMRDIAREQLREQRQSTVDKVKKTYYGILQTQSSMEAAGESIKFLRELDRLEGRYWQQQVVLKSEVLEVKAKLAKSEQQELSLRNNLATQKEQMNDLLGRNILTPFRVQAVPLATSWENDLEAARTQALKQRPEIKEARLKTRQAEYDRSIKKAEYIPDISFFASYARAVNLDPVPENTGFLGFMLYWEPFDWGRKRKELAEKTDAIAQTINLTRETESQILIDVNSKFRKLHETRSALRATQMAQEAVREKLREELDKFKNGTALTKDVLQSQTSLAEADSQHHQALMSFWTAKADFEKAIGEEK